MCRTQGCYYNYLQENTFKKLASTVAHAETVLASSPEITGDRLVIPFTHDYGSCTGWWPKLEDVLGHSPPSPMHQALAWQVNGDYNTHCIKVDRDVVVPAVTKHTKALFETLHGTPAARIRLFKLRKAPSHHYPHSPACLRRHSTRDRGCRAACTARKCS